jgi:hypothetical protein
MEELEHIVYCERVGKPVLITVHKSGEIVSLCVTMRRAGGTANTGQSWGAPCTENSWQG